MEMHEAGDDHRLRQVENTSKEKSTLLHIPM